MDMNEILQKAQKMQEEMEKLGSSLAAKTYTGSASNGLVKITLDGENNAVRAEIDPSILTSEDKDMVEDLIVLAINDAVAQIDAERKSAFGSILKG